MSRQLASRVDQPNLKVALELVESSLAMYGGNLEQAATAAERGLELATRHDMRWAIAGSATNLGFLALCNGRPARASHYLRLALRESHELAFVRLGALDNLAHVMLFNGDLDGAIGLISQCGESIDSQRLPCRSWYDLAHQITRCSYHERLEQWHRVLEIVDDTEPEVARRQFRALRTTLLCARARALAQLGKHAKADAALATAVRSCPKGAIDPLIVVEASRGLCSSLAGDRAVGALHFDRALAGCRAIGHRYHEAWIGRVRPNAAVAPGTLAVPDNVRRGDERSAAIVLGDVAAVLGAGHSIDLLSHRLTAILEQTSLAARLQIESESGLSFRTETSVEFQSSPTGTSTIQLRGSDRRIVFRIHDVHGLEDIALVKHIVDLVQTALRRPGDADGDDGQQNLWPDVTPSSGDDTVFQSPQMVELLRVAMRLAAAELPILVTGETGTGKEILARFIHESSRVARGPFVAFNCATMPRDLVESQLFGHRRGAFTGALDSFPGVIRAAERGTLFLDEIGDLDPAVQPKLLRFLESGEVHPVGEAKPVTVKVRVVAATNANLDELVKQNRFREDLFYRIGVAKLVMPPLRERKDEIPALAALFVEKFSRECQRRHIHLADDFIAALLLYDWPGNIRQLANEIRRVIAMAADGDTLRSSSLSPEIARPWNVRPTTFDASTSAVPVRLDQSLEQATAELERRFIEHAMAAAGGRVADAAQLLGLSRKGLFLKRRRQGLIPR
jgi:transcriptional regulator with PAS, ATPase and Fis domain/tetratricopeptide (TPR) repeat protein